MQQKRRLLRSLKSARTRLLNVKVTDWEADRIQDLADRHASGNKSEWIRYAALNFIPRKRDLVPLDETDPDSPLVIEESSLTPRPS